MKHVLFCTGHDLLIPNIVKSGGVFLYEDSGKRYMDLESGIWCTSLGHGHPEITGIIRNQMNQLMHAGYCYSHEIVERAAQSILDVAGFEQGKCVFLCSGSEGIEISRQIAKHLTGKKRSMTLHDSYLGSYSSVVDRSYNWHLLNWEVCKTCAVKETCDLSCEVLEDIPDDIADFVFEPGSSSGFVRFPPKALINNIVQIIRGNGGLIIANEVTTGIGRTGKWFGYQHYDITPDLIAVGKGLGNGYPVSAALISPAIVNDLKLKTFHYSQSHQNDPLGASVAHGVIRYIKENDLIVKAEADGDYFLHRLKKLVDENIILDVRGRGLMIAVDIKDETTATVLHQMLIDDGYIVANRGRLFRIDPPLTITRADLDSFVNKLSEAKCTLTLPRRF